MSISTWAGVAAMVVACGTLVVLPAGSAGARPGECVKKAIVTDGGDSSDTTTTGQLRTAIAQVCEGGSVEVAPSVSTISLDYDSITVDKTVKVSGKGQTIYPGGQPVFYVGPTGHLLLTGFTLRGPRIFSGIKVDGELTLKKVTVTEFGRGGIWANPGSFVTLKKDTLLTGNRNDRAEGGLGIYNDGGTVQLFDDAAVSDNVGFACFTVPGIPARGYGAGIFSKGGGSITLHDHAVVSGNYLNYCDQSRCPPDGFCPTGSGGGISSFGGAVTLNDHAQVSGNWAASGGGIDLEADASLTLNDKSRVTGNNALGSGGGVRVFAGSELTLNGKASITGNTADDNGGGVSNVNSLVTLNGKAGITDNTAGGNGGGVYNSDVSSTLPPPELVVNDSATITGNTPDDVAP